MVTYYVMYVTGGGEGRIEGGAVVICTVLNGPLFDTRICRVENRYALPRIAIMLRPCIVLGYFCLFEYTLGKHSICQLS